MTTFAAELPTLFARSRSLLGCYYQDRRGVPRVGVQLLFGRDRELVAKDLEAPASLVKDVTDKTRSVKEWLHDDPRICFHFIPRYSSWMNLVEKCFGELTSRAF